MPAKTVIQTRRDTAANWTSANPTLASGEIGFETDTSKFKIGNGSTAWTSLAYQISTPSGVLSPFAGSTAPSGWLLCDGASYSTTGTYSGLFGVIGYTYGGSGGSFNVPDLRGRIPVALDNMGGTDAGRLSVANTLGGSGGEEKHTLTTTETPSHSHTAGKYDSLGIGNAAVAAGGDYQAVVATGSSATSRILTNTTGGDGAHNNMQPYILMNYIIKA